MDSVPAVLRFLLHSFAVRCPENVRMYRFVLLWFNFWHRERKEAGAPVYPRVRPSRSSRNYDGCRKISCATRKKRTRPENKVGRSRFIMKSIQIIRECLFREWAEAPPHSTRSICVYSRMTFFPIRVRVSYQTDNTNHRSGFISVPNLK